VGDVHDLEFGVRAGAGLFEHPVPDGFALPARTGASEDDSNLEHRFLLTD
jgi:hypothetical protein